MKDKNGQPLAENVHVYDEAEARATREKTARFKALRLAREAEIVIAL